MFKLGLVLIIYLSLCAGAVVLMQGLESPVSIGKSAEKETKVELMRVENNEKEEKKGKKEEKLDV